MIATIIVITIIQAAVCGAFCKYAAKEKGKDPDIQAEDQARKARKGL